MFVFKFDLVLLLMFCQVCYCQRRIKNGANVTSEQSFVVYLVKADLAGKNYDFWTCGGALVTVDFIITSAACVEDVNYLYAVAGYKKLVEDWHSHEKDPCISKKRKKVIFTCVPLSYQLDYDVLEKWAYIDIALVKVESPYDLQDTSYLEYCSYIPTVIPINYDAKYQKGGMDAMVLGWGHEKRWRMHGDYRNYNMEYLQYAPIMIMDKEECMQEYSIYPNMSQLIDNFMICSLEPGNIDENGKPIYSSDPTAKGCSGPQKLLGLPECEEVDIGHNYDNTRRGQPENKTLHNYTINNSTKRLLTRRNGICQNDHGGPVITWVGTSKILIGIASVFKVTQENRCIGPYLYTSTQCNGAFLDCVLTSEELTKKKGSRRGAELCDSPPSVKGYSTIERKISWKDHPAGPAENEMEQIRESASLSYNQNFAEQNMANQKYIENERYVENVDYPQNPYDNIARVGNPNEQLFIRPQRPLHV